jgi:hypothetical protein
MYYLNFIFKICTRVKPTQRLPRDTLNICFINPAILRGIIQAMMKPHVCCVRGIIVYDEASIRPHMIS